MPTNYPIYPAFADDFADGVADANWTDVGDTIAEVGGVCRIAPTGAGAHRFLAFLELDGGVFAADVAAAFAAAPVGASARASVEMGGGARYLYVGKKRTNAGWFIVVEEGDGTVHCLEASDDAAARFEIRRSGAFVEFLIIEAGVGRQLATLNDWSGEATFGLHVAQSYAAGYADFDDASYESTGSHIERIDSRIHGQHLALMVRVYGSGFATGASAQLVSPAGSEACTVTVVGETELMIVAAVQSRPGWRRLVVRPHTFGPPLEIGDLVVSGVGYKIQRALLPPGRYTADPANLFNVFLAAIGLENDRLEAAAVAFKNEEIHPETTVRLIHRHEQRYGLPLASGDELQLRRDRVVMKATMKPRISKPYLEALAQAIKAAAQIVENAPYSVFGRLIWQYQVYESTPNELDQTTHAELERTLQAAGPGWAQARVGHAGFVVGKSKVGRDFVAKETG